MILNQVVTMLGTMLSKEEVEDFMMEADVVLFMIFKLGHIMSCILGWKWKT